jgi:hypothetical protein
MLYWAETCNPWHKYTYLLIPWSRVLLQKLTGFQQIKKFPAFYGTRRFVTAFTSACHLFLSQSISPGPMLCLWIFRNKIRFYGEELSPPRPTPKPEDHPLSAVRNCFFNIFAATHHTRGRSSIRNLRTRHADVTGTHLQWTIQFMGHNTLSRKLKTVS